ncbi:hypothetical protein HK101_006280, partial [Irineochytrium annulatum]
MFKKKDHQQQQQPQPGFAPAGPGAWQGQQQPIQQDKPKFSLPKINMKKEQSIPAQQPYQPQQQQMQQPPQPYSPAQPQPQQVFGSPTTYQPQQPLPQAPQPQQQQQPPIVNTANVVPDVVPRPGLVAPPRGQSRTMTAPYEAAAASASS